MIKSLKIKKATGRPVLKESDLAFYKAVEPFRIEFQEEIMKETHLFFDRIKCVKGKV